MATIDLSKVEASPTEVVTLPRNKQIPKGRYDLRIKEAKFGLSNASGKKMITLDVEIINPETVEHNQGGVFQVAGLSCKKILMMHNSQSLKELGGFLTRLGLPTTIDDENPDTEQFVGKVFSDIVKSQRREQRADPTAEQLAENPKAVGDVLIDPDTGAPMITYGIETDFGLANVRGPMKPAASL